MSELERVKRDIRGETRWCVVGPLGGVDFHCTSDEVLATFPESLRGMGRSGGVEVHRREPADYQQGRAADLDKCWLLEGPCWCDGSSLYASEVLIPTFEWCLRDGDFEPLWQQLEGEYRSRFERGEN